MKRYDSDGHLIQSDTQESKFVLFTDHEEEVKKLKEETEREKKQKLENQWNYEDCRGELNRAEETIDDLSTELAALKENPIMGVTEEQAKLLINMAIQREVSAEREATKKLAIEFFYWWHNQPGTNTEQGYDTFIRQRGAQ